MGRPGGAKENLKPFKKGHDPRRNLTGRPKTLPSLEDAMIAILGEVKNEKTALEAILAALRAKASRGNERAAEILLDRGYGKAKQSLEHTGKDGSELFKPMDDAQVDKVIAALRETKKE